MVVMWIRRVLRMAGLMSTRDVCECGGWLYDGLCFECGRVTWLMCY